MYTEEQVLAAYFAKNVMEDLDYKGNINQYYSEMYDEIEGNPTRQEIVAKFEKGKKLLKEARLIVTHRGIVIHDRPEVDSPLVAVDAGHIAMSEAHRLVGLKKK